MQDNQQNIKRYEEDEIDLRELFRTLFKNKNKIIIITLLITIIAIIYAYTMPKIYEVKSNIQIGYIGKNLVTEPDTLIKTLNLVFNVEDKLVTNEKFISEVFSITTNKKLKNFIEVKTQAVSNDEALKKNKEVLEFIKKTYKSNINQYIIDIKNNIKTTKREISNIDEFIIKNIDQEIEFLKTKNIVKIDEKIEFYKNVNIKSIELKIDFHNNKLKEYTKAIDSLYSNSSSNNNNGNATSILLSIQTLNYQNLILNSQNKIEDLKVEKEIIIKEKIVSLERKKDNIIKDSIRKLEYKKNVELVNNKIKLTNKIDKLSFNMSDQNIQKSKVVGGYIINDNPIKPKKKLIIIVSFISGFIFSIFLVFFLEFIKGVRLDSKSNQE